MFKRITDTVYPALYCASIIIGAGALSIPLTGYKLGFAALLAMMLVVGTIVIFLYGRMSDTVFGTVSILADEKQKTFAQALTKGCGITWTKGMSEMTADWVTAREIRKGSALFLECAKRAGLKNVGVIALLAGMVFYVVPADVGYITLC